MLGCRAAASSRFHRRTSDDAPYRPSPRGRTAPEDHATAQDPEGVRPRIFFQQNPEGKTAKNRLHPYVRAAPGPHGDERMAVLDTECERLVGLGAARLRRDEPAPSASAGYIVMADPEGSEFCLD
ncbi:VOC family protein [Streptomyces sp. NPDC057539]|uniref:VOC family protein n=1 Tax=Streptomyces sp. NPDC057539 TaxID=3346159 RepID=UPI0036885591